MLQMFLRVSLKLISQSTKKTIAIKKYLNEATTKRNVLKDISTLENMVKGKSEML